MRSGTAPAWRAVLRAAGEKGSFYTRQRTAGQPADRDTQRL